LLISPEKAMVIYDVLAGRIGVPVLEAGAADGEGVLLDGLGRPVPGTYRDAASRRWTGERLPSISVSKGVAHITIDGSLVNRGAYVGASSGLISYEGLHTQLTEAEGRDDVTSILLDLNSPGGEAGGMFALAAKVRDVAAKKMVIAFVNDLAASAAYGIAASASQIVISPSSIVGSIGVVLLHMDRSDQLAKAGMKPTLIHAGAHKVDGNPFGPLPDGVRSDLQAHVENIYGLFLDTVAAGRGAKLTKRAARATEARVFMGQEAVSLGLADGMASFEETMSALQKGRKVQFTQAKPQGGRTRMSTENEGAALAATPMVTINVGGTGASTEAPAAAAPASPAPATTAPAAPAPTAEAAPVDQKARIKAITTCEEAAGRETLANHLAFDTDMSVDAAKAILAASPKAAAATAEAYAQQKTEAGTLGLGVPAPSTPSAAKSGWSKAVAEANRRFEPAR
ncbi:MAG: peptidase S49, partial [Xanthobacteraceae bacterium]